MSHASSIPLSPVRRWSWLMAWLAVLLLSVAGALLADRLGFRPWAGVTPLRVEGYHHEQCENVDTARFLLQFMNFWSNFAYLAVGLIIVSLNESRFGLLLGGGFVLLAFGSGFFHGSLTEWGQTLDIAGVYVALLVILVYALVEWRGWGDTSPRTAWLLVAAFILGTVAAIYRTSYTWLSSNHLTPVLVGVIVLVGLIGYFRFSDRRKRQLTGPGLGALLAGAAAVLFKFTDGDDNALAQHGGNYDLCTYPHDGWLQGHALWHLLSALMFWCMFEFFREFQRRSRPVFQWRLRTHQAWLAGELPSR